MYSFIKQNCVSVNCVRDLCTRLGRRWKYIVFFRRFSFHFFFFLVRFKRCSRFVSVECFSNLIIYCQRSLCGCLWVKTAIINEKSPWSIVIQFFFSTLRSFRTISTILQLNIVHTWLPSRNSRRRQNPHLQMRSQFPMCTHKNSFTYNLSTEMRTEWRLFSLLMKFIIYDSL